MTIVREKTHKYCDDDYLKVTNETMCGVFGEVGVLHHWDTDTKKMQIEGVIVSTHVAYML